MGVNQSQKCIVYLDLTVYDTKYLTYHLNIKPSKNQNFMHVLLVEVHNKIKHNSKVPSIKNSYITLQKLNNSKKLMKNL